MMAFKCPDPVTITLTTEEQHNLQNVQFRKPNLEVVGTKYKTDKV